MIKPKEPSSYPHVVDVCYYSEEEEEEQARVRLRTRR